MPFVNFKLVEEVFPEEPKHEMAEAITEVMVRSEASEELHQGPAWLMGTLGRSKTIFESIGGDPKSRQELAAALPAKEAP
jgi:hypothetical protein